MAEVLAELVAKITADATELKSGLADADKDITGWVEKSSAQFKAVGMALTGFGVAITGTLGMAVKSAADEEAGILKLQQALKNVGVSYDEVKGSLEGVIAATVKKTSISDDAQRAALLQLVGITNSYEKSLELLPLAMDLATAKGMDLSSAAMVIGRVAEGNTAILTRYGVVIKEGATASEALAALQAKFAGQAEVYGQSVAGQFANIKNAMEDTMESIGTTVLPILNDLFKNYIIPLIDRVKEWTEAHPELTKQLVILAAAVGGLAVVLGPLLIILPGLITAIGLLTGPIGLAVLAIMALIAVGVLLWQNWDTIKTKAIEVWGAIESFFGNVWENIANSFKWGMDWIGEYGLYFLGLPGLIIKNWEGISGFFANLWDGIVETFNKSISFITDKINWATSIINKLPGINIGVTTATMQPPPEKMASGGIVTQPTMALIGEAGPEAVIPLGEGGMGGIVINFTQPVFFDREDTMNAFINKIKAGINRADRLRFGGAWDGR